MIYSKQQNIAVVLIKNLEKHFGVGRWFTQCELTDITMHTIKALIEKGCLESQVYKKVSYYRWKGI